MANTKFAALMQAAGYDREEMAVILGVSPHTVQSWESGATPTLRRAIEVVVVLNRALRGNGRTPLTVEDVFAEAALRR